MNNCPLCELDNVNHDNLWRVFGQRLSLKDVKTLFEKQNDISISEEQINEHFRFHPVEQPTPEGKKMNRGHALQEAMTTFPKYLHYMFRALYRAKALSQEQIYNMFYLGQASGDSEDIKKVMQDDLFRLTMRNYLYRVYPEQFPNLSFSHQGPFYFIGRQGIPLVEKLEGIVPGEMGPKHYMTNFQNVEPYNMEIDLKFLDTVVALRSKLYNRSFAYNGETTQIHLAIENWFSASELTAQIDLGNARNINFTPDSVVGFRCETRSGELSTLLPLWLSYDRGIDEIADVVDNTLAFGLYFQHEKYKKTFPRLYEQKTPGPVIIICETPHRRDELASALKPQFEQSRREIPIYLTDKETFCTDPYMEGALYSPQQTGKSFDLIERLFYHNQKLIRHRTFTSTDSLDEPSTHQLLASNTLSLPSANKPVPGLPSSPVVNVKSTIEPNFDAWNDE